MQKLIGFILCSLLMSLLMLDTGHAARVSLPRTGQTASYAAGDDGAKLKGVVPPTPRFTNNGDGTVKDNLTGLFWLKNANCLETSGGIAKASSTLTWVNALTWSNALASGSCGLTDGSTVGQWRLPSRNELESLVDLSKSSPALSTDHPFTSVHSNIFWSSSIYSSSTSAAWHVGIGAGGVVSFGSKASNLGVLPVRVGQ